MLGNINNKRPSGKKPDARRKAVSQKYKTYSGVIKNTGARNISGRVYLKEDHSIQKQSIWGLVVVILVLGLAAALIPFATGYIDLNNLSMKAAGMEWYYVGFSVLGLTVIGFALEEIYRERKS